MEVTDVPHHVLAIVVNFMYGHDVPQDFESADVETLLAMADLYLVENLKESVARLVGKRLSKENILATYKLAEKYGADQLKEMCHHFIFNYIDCANRLFGRRPGECCQEQEGHKKPISLQRLHDELHRAKHASAL